MFHSSAHPSLPKSHTNSVFSHNLNPSHSLFIISGSLAAPLLIRFLVFHSLPPSPHPSSLHLSFPSTLSTLMDFTAGGSLRSAFKKQRERNVCHFSP